MKQYPMHIDSRAMWDKSRVESAVSELAGYFCKTILETLSHQTN